MPLDTKTTYHGWQTPAWRTMSQLIASYWAADTTYAVVQKTHFAVLLGKRNVVSVVLFVEPVHFRMKEVRMKTGITVFAAMLLLPFAQAVVAGENVRPTLEKKLHGEWKGGPGVGEIVFRPDGTFERRNDSPGNHILKGTWELKSLSE